MWKNFFRWFRRPIQEKQQRLGVYGSFWKEGKLLVILQRYGPYAGKYDLPGGGIEFGEEVESALKREFVEEVGLIIEDLHWVGNFTRIIEYIREERVCTLYHVGLIYRIESARSNGQIGEMESYWIEPDCVRQEQCSPFLWEVLSLC